MSLSRPRNRVEAMSIEHHAVRRTVALPRATARVGVAITDELARQNSGLDGVDDVLLACIELRAVVGQVDEAFAEGREIRSLFVVHPLVELAHHAVYVVMERSALEDVEY